LQDRHEPQVLAPQLFPSVFRAQPAVSVSVPIAPLHVPLPQVYVVIERLREPELVQVLP
jgi:hypothetical protein